MATNLPPVPYPAPTADPGTLWYLQNKPSTADSNIHSDNVRKGLRLDATSYSRLSAEFQVALDQMFQSTGNSTMRLVTTAAQTNARLVRDRIMQTHQNHFGWSSISGTWVADALWHVAKAVAANMRRSSSKNTSQSPIPQTPVGMSGGMSGGMPSGTSGFGYDGKPEDNRSLQTPFPPSASQVGISPQFDSLQIHVAHASKDEFQDILCVYKKSTSDQKPSQDLSAIDYDLEALQKALVNEIGFNAEEEDLCYRHSLGDRTITSDRHFRVALHDLHVTQFQREILRFWIRARNSTGPPSAPPGSRPPTATSADLPASSTAVQSTVASSSGTSLPQHTPPSLAPLNTIEEQNKNDDDKDEEPLARRSSRVRGAFDAVKQKFQKGSRKSSERESSEKTSPRQSKRPRYNKSPDDDKEYTENGSDHHKATGIAGEDFILPADDGNEVG